MAMAAETGSPDDAANAGQGEQSTPPPKQGNWLQQRTQYIFDYALETYYQHIAGHTAVTEFICLTAEDAVAFYKECSPTETSSAEERQRVADIRDRIDAVMKKPPFDGKAFVKLSTRSPKDAVTGSINQRMVASLESELAEMDKLGAQTPNDDTIAFVNASRKAFMVSSAEEAVKLLTSSSRVREDLARAGECAELVDLNIIVREWTPMRASMEFRGFVYKRQLTAVSQYCYLQCFPDLLDETARSAALVKMRAVFEEIKDVLPMENCIIDFVILDSGEAQVVELNPFFNDTSACLFSWKSADDRAIIKGAQHSLPFELSKMQRTLYRRIERSPQEGRESE